jgi:cytochrome c oxidase subunit 2
MRDKRVEVLKLHDYIIVNLFIILVFILLVFLFIIKNKTIVQEWNEVWSLEIIWTLIPTFILILMGVPSFYILYSHERREFCPLTLKVIAHQWYWRYDYTQFSLVEFDRYTKPVDRLLLGEWRLLDVDNRVILPINVWTQLLVSRTDVIHSFSVPSLSLKVDCNPGYLNRTHIFLVSPGVYYGMCRELCGAGHRNISICLEGTSMFLFKCWVSTFYI